MVWDWTIAETRDEGDGSGPACPLSTATPSFSTFVTSIASETATDDSQTETVETTYEDTATTEAPTSTEEVSTEFPTSTEAFTTEPTEEPTTTEVPIEIESTEEPVSISTFTPPPIELTPLERLPAVCNNAEDFPGHVDIKASSVWQTVVYFCTWLDESQEKKYYQYWHSSRDHIVYDAYEVGFNYTIDWRDGCHVAEHGGDDWQYVLYPLGKDGQTCTQIFTGIWNECKFSSGSLGNSLLLTMIST